MSRKKNIRVTTDDILYQIRPEFAYPVRISDWNRIKQIAKKIKAPNKWCDRIGSALLGIAISEMVQFIYNCCQLTENEVWYKGSVLAKLIVSIMCLILSVLVFMLDNEKNKAYANGGEELLEEMSNLEGKFCPIEDEGIAL